MSYSSESIPDAQPDPFYQCFDYPELYSFSSFSTILPPEIPDSQLSQLSSVRDHYRLPSEIPDSRLSQLSSVREPYRLPSEIPDSQEQNSQPSIKEYALATSRDDRIAIQTALKFKIPHSRIRKVLGVTESQIEYTRNHRITPQKSKTGRKPLLRTPQRNCLEEWLLSSPSHRRIRFDIIPRHILEFERIGEKAIKTAFDLLGYC